MKETLDAEGNSQLNGIAAVGSSGGGQLAAPLRLTLGAAAWVVTGFLGTDFRRSSRFTERTNAVTDVKIYSNAARAELFLNGESQGTRDNDGNAIFIWKDIKLSTGKNQIEARAEKGGTPVSDSCVWTLK